MVQAVILDMDGVIVDSEPLQVESFNRALSQYDVTLTEDDFRQLVGKTQPEIFAIVKDRFGISEETESLMARKREIYLELGEARLKAMPGLHELVDWLKSLGLRTGVASSSPLEDVQAVLRWVGLDGELDVVLSSVNLTRGKPYPDVYLLAARQLCVGPSHCVVLEDSVIGVEAAKRASMVCIAMPSFFTRHQDFSMADYVVESLFEARVVLEGLIDQEKTE